MRALQLIGCVVWRNQAGEVRVRGGVMRLAPAGTPDIIGYAQDGRCVAIEVKTPRGRTDPARARLQAAWREQAAKAGCIVGVARSAQEAVDIVRGGRRSR